MQGQHKSHLDAVQRKKIEIAKLPPSIYIFWLLLLMKDDVVMGTLTVRENLKFSAALRLPKSVKEWEKNERVDQIMKELGLSKVADTKVRCAITGLKS